MKTFLKTMFLLWGITACAAADDQDSYDKTVSLPPGPLIARMGNFSTWQIAYTYENEKPPQPGQAPVAHNTQIKSLTITRTMPAYHAVAVLSNGVSTECWWDGSMPFLDSSTDPTPQPLMLNVPGVVFPDAFDYRGNRDFLDLNWVKPGTYLGLQKGTTYWVFQQGGEKKAWIDSNTRLPVRLKIDGETRTYSYPPAPTQRIVFPPDVERISKQYEYINKISTAPAPHGA